MGGWNGWWPGTAAEVLFFKGAKGGNFISTPKQLANCVDDDDNIDINYLIRSIFFLLFSINYCYDECLGREW